MADKVVRCYTVFTVQRCHYYLHVNGLQTMKCHFRYSLLCIPLQILGTQPVRNIFGKAMRQSPGYYKVCFAAVTVSNPSQACFASRWLGSVHSSTLFSHVWHHTDKSGSCINIQQAPCQSSCISFLCMGPSYSERLDHRSKPWLVSSRVVNRPPFGSKPANHSLSAQLFKLPSPSMVRVRSIACNYALQNGVSCLHRASTCWHTTLHASKQQMKTAYCCKMRAAAPATWAALMEVPVSVTYSPSRPVPSIDTPGAISCTNTVYG